MCPPPGLCCGVGRVANLWHCGGLLHCFLLRLRHQALLQWETDKWSGGYVNRLEWKCFSPVRCSDIVPHVTSSDPSCVSAKHPLRYRRE
ncbi:hypothetical protein ILYODFUR_007867 [Ilyodon furcidens]|uniref:Secreted protein n=1 Tax=Ilyodon furcidens TaxID=33524 RepID=A0ABV0SK19_9TELE